MLQRSREMRCGGRLTSLRSKNTSALRSTRGGRSVVEGEEGAMPSTGLHEEPVFQFFLFAHAMEREVFVFRGNGVVAPGALGVQLATSLLTP